MCPRDLHTATHGFCVLCFALSMFVWLCIVRACLFSRWESRRQNLWVRNENHQHPPKTVARVAVSADGRFGRCDGSVRRLVGVSVYISHALYMCKYIYARLRGCLGYCTPALTSVSCVRCRCRRRRRRSSEQLAAHISLYRRRRCQQHCAAVF